MMSPHLLRTYCCQTLGWTPFIYEAHTQKVILTLQMKLSHLPMVTEVVSGRARV